MESTGIRLFGKKISFPERPAAGTAGEENSDGGECKYIGSDHDLTTREERVNIQDLEKDELKEKNSEAKPEDKSSPKSMEESDGTTNFETEGETPNSQSKSLKKPDKILPCPRCNSMDTKFCYYNNYNVSQPRHFCKSCQRYWTAGGTMRTMPVGAGRRKTKTFDGVRGIPLKVLSFASDSPHVGQENGDDCSSGSTVTTSNSVADKTQDKNGFHSQVPCIPGVSWPYNPWNSAIPIPIPAFCPPMPFYPSPYWNYIPWVSPSMNQNAQFASDPNLLILGKHSRDENSMKPNGCQEESKKHKNTVLIPKTLRIDDPDEAAKSSIWATLGIKNETSIKGGAFKAFQAKGEENKKSPEAMPSAVLYANPAALSRSLCFQERA